MRGPGIRVGAWPPARSGEAVEALADAFHDYPVMRYIIGEAGADYDRRLELGVAAKARSEKLIEIWERLAVPGPQHHVNMLGVRHSHAGRGLGRLLLDAVHEMSRRDAESAGVSLSTEDPKNVTLYQHCGYEIKAHERVSNDLETWILFRKDDAPDEKA